MATIACSDAQSEAVNAAATEPADLPIDSGGESGDGGEAVQDASRSPSECVADMDCPSDGPCRRGRCVAGVCKQEARTGPVCDDGNQCTEGDRCVAGQCEAGAGVCACETDGDCHAVLGGDLCVGDPYCRKDHHPWSCAIKPGTRVVCDPGKDEQCRKQQCQPDTGFCATVPLPDLTLCNDGDPCSVESACSAGVCQPSTASWCQCKGDADCAKLDDGDKCNGALFCDVGQFPWQCRVNPASVVNCSGGENAPPCHSVACQAKTGMCETVAVADKTPCDDGNPKTAGDVCVQGACTPGTNVAACSKTADCAALEDGNLCNGVLFCNLAEGLCTVNPATVIQCPTVDDTDCSKRTCLPQTGHCVLSPLANGSPCDDGDACTAGEICLTGGCSKGKNICLCSTDADCADKDDGDKCNGLLFCNKATGGCQHNPASIVTCPTVQDTPCRKSKCTPLDGSCALADEVTGTACDDDDPCTAKGSCDGLGACTAGTKICTCASDGDCAKEEDGNLCNGKLFCDKSGKVPQCKLNPASVVTCPTVDDTACLKNRCQVKTGGCLLTPEPGGAKCDDGNPCTEGDLCNGGQCKPGVDTCECQQDADCEGKDDGDKCNGTFYCKKAGLVKPKCEFNPASEVFCKKLVGEQCLLNACVPQTGACKIQPLKDGTPCDDGSVCTTKDACDGGACTGSQLSCDDGNACTEDLCAPASGCVHKPAASHCDDGNSCTTDVCDPNTGKCDNALVSAGKACDADQSGCTVNDGCSKGACVAGPEVACQIKVATCQQAACQSKGANGFECVAVAAADGSGCDDGKSCAAGAVCKAGKCQPGVKDKLFVTKMGDDAWSTGLSAVTADDAGTGFFAAGVRHVMLADKVSETTWWGVRLDAAGTALWNHIWKLPLGDLGARVAGVAVQSGQVVIGGTAVAADGARRLRLLRLTGGGAVISDKLFTEGGTSASVRSMAALADGGVVLAGQTSTAGDLQALVVRISAGGSALWTRTHGGAGEDGASVILDLVGGSLLLAGYAQQAGGVGSVGSLRLLDSAGAAKWSRTYGEGSSQRFSGLARRADGGVVLGGFADQDGARKWWVVRTDAAGEALWSRLGVGGDFEIAAVGVTQGGQILASGRAGKQAGGVFSVSDGWLMALDELGNVRWDRSHGAGTLGSAVAAAVLADGSALSVGQVQDQGQSRALLVRSDAWGNASCAASGNCVATSAAGCDDGKPCTVDLCHAAKGCQHLPAEGLTCGLGDGCAPRFECAGGKCAAAPGGRLWTAIHPIADLKDVAQVAGTPTGGLLVAANRNAGTPALLRIGADGQAKVLDSLVADAQHGPAWGAAALADGSVLTAGYGPSPGVSANELRRSWPAVPGVKPATVQFCARDPAFPNCNQQNHTQMSACVGMGVHPSADGKLAYAPYHRFAGNPAECGPHQRFLDCVGVLRLDLGAGGLKVASTPQLCEHHYRTGNGYIGTFTHYRRRDPRLQSLPDGGAIVAMRLSTYKQTSGVKDLLLQSIRGGLWRIDAAGNTLFETWHGRPVPATLHAAQLMPGGYVAAGLELHPNALTRIWLLGVDEAGKHLWSQSVGPVGQVAVGGLRPLPGGGFQLAATRPIALVPTFELLRTGPAGALVAQQPLPPPGEVVALPATGGLVPGPGSDLLLGGAALSVKGGKAVALRVDAWGHASCSAAGACGGVAEAQCSDGKSCTADTCVAGKGCSHEPSDCDDGAPCTIDKCDDEAGCGYEANACDDDDVCTTDSCEPTAGCQHEQLKCSDSKLCTIDTCDKKKGCQYAAGKDGSPCLTAQCKPGTCQAGKCNGGAECNPVPSP